MGKYSSRGTAHVLRPISAVSAQGAGACTFHPPATHTAPPRCLRMCTPSPGVVRGPNRPSWPARLAPVSHHAVWPRRGRCADRCRRQRRPQPDAALPAAGPEPERRDTPGGRADLRPGRGRQPRACGPAAGSTPTPVPHAPLPPSPPCALSQTQYYLILGNIIADAAVPMDVRQLAALNFKNGLEAKVRGVQRSGRRAAQTTRSTLAGLTCRAPATAQNEYIQEEKAKRWLSVDETSRSTIKTNVRSAGVSPALNRRRRRVAVRTHHRLPCAPCSSS